jgi:hypothetical protein
MGLAGPLIMKEDLDGDMFATGFSPIHDLRDIWSLRYRHPLGRPAGSLAGKGLVTLTLVLAVRGAGTKTNLR